MKKTIHMFGQVINHTLSICLWLIERMVTRLGFVISAFAIYFVLCGILKSIFSEDLVGTAFYVAEENRIGFWDAVGTILCLAICLLIIAPISQKLGEILEHLMDELRWRQDKSVEIDNKEISKKIFIIWVLVAFTFAFFNLITLFDYSILYVVSLLALDLLLGWFLFIYSVDLEPYELLFFLEIFSSGPSGCSGGSSGTYVFFRID